MAEAFLGLHMLVTLSVPPGTQLQGKVSSIVAGQSLTLRDGMLAHFFFVYTGAYV